MHGNAHTAHRVQFALCAIACCRHYQEAAVKQQDSLPETAPAEAESDHSVKLPAHSDGGASAARYDALPTSALHTSTTTKKRMVRNDSYSLATTRAGVQHIVARGATAVEFALKLMVLC